MALPNGRSNAVVTKVTKLYRRRSLRDNRCLHSRPKRDGTCPTIVPQTPITKDSTANSESLSKGMTVRGNSSVTVVWLNKHSTSTANRNMRNSKEKVNGHVLRKTNASSASSHRRSVTTSIFSRESPSLAQSNNRSVDTRVDRLQSAGILSTTERFSQSASSQKKLLSNDLYGSTNQFKRKRKEKKRYLARCVPVLLLCGLLLAGTIGAIIAAPLIKPGMVIAITTTMVTPATTATTTATVTAPPLAINSSNMLINGDGETGLCENSTGITSPTGWAVNGTLTQINYTNPANAGHHPGIPGPTDRGDCYFYGQITSSTSMWQDINVLNFASINAIDASTVRFNLSAWLGGFSNQDDHATVSIVFYDQMNQILSVGPTIGPVLAVHRNSITSLLYRETTGFLPVGTRSVRVIVTFIRSVGAALNGAVDNIALYLY